jgi:hypothetical protein
LRASRATIRSVVDLKLIERSRVVGMATTETSLPRSLAREGVEDV